MAGENEARFGEQFYKGQKKLYGDDSVNWHNTKADYIETREVALADPNFDFFDAYMPTERSKHDIGRYALRNYVRVPLVDSLDELNQAAMEDGIIIRSDGRDEYDGPSGLRSSYVLRRTHFERFENPHYVQDIANIPIGCDELVLHAHNYRSTPAEINHTYNRLTTKHILNGVMYPGAPFGVDEFHTSLWRYISGDNIVMMRDPVQEDLYHFKWGDYTSSRVRTSEYDEGYPVFMHGDGLAKHYQRVVDFGDAQDLERATGMWNPDTNEWEPNRSLIPAIWAPIQDAISMYEKVRTLPLFDQRQVPVMEMQYSREQKKLYFLQYLKTGRLLNNLDAFPLPTGPNIVHGDDVVGATTPEGEKIRIHVGVTDRNARQAEFYVKDEGILLPHEMILDGSTYLQSLALHARAAFVDYLLTFHNHHFGSAMFTRTPMSVGLYDWKGKIEEKILNTHYQYMQDNPDESIGYINAIVTSNGREVAVESDWQPHRVDGA